MKNLIHHTAIINQGAEIDHNVSIGPYSIYALDRFVLECASQFT